MEILKTKKCKNCQKLVKKKIQNKNLIGISKFCSIACFFEWKNIQGFKVVKSGRARQTLIDINTTEERKIYLDMIVFGKGIGRIDSKGNIKRINFVEGEEIKKQKPERDKVYLKFLNTLPCLICGKKGSEAAHTEYCGLGIKGSDLSSISLCADCHRGSKGLDSIGQDKFEKVHNVNIKDLNIKCLRKYIQWLKKK